jgi:carbon starvation protein CstA
MPHLVSSRPNQRLADAIGLAAVALQTATVVHWLVTDDGYRLLIGFPGFFALSACALWMWHDEKTAEKLSNSNEWAAAVVSSVLMGAVSFAIDVMVGSWNNPGTSVFQAAAKASGPFGIALTILICPGLTIVTIAGLVRSVFWQARKPASDSRL